MTGLSPAAVEPPDAIRPEELRDGNLDRKGTWVVAFVADWCPFCRQFLPEFARLAGPGIGIARADLTSYGSPLWDDYRIEVVPTVVVFRDGRPTFRLDGRLGEGLDAHDLEQIGRAAGSR